MAAFAVVPDGKVTWNYERRREWTVLCFRSRGVDGCRRFRKRCLALKTVPRRSRRWRCIRRRAVVRVACVRSDSSRGQDTLILAFVGAYPLHASTQSGAPVELPKPDMRRDGSGTDLSAPIAVVG